MKKKNISILPPQTIQAQILKEYYSKPFPIRKGHPPYEEIEYIKLEDLFPKPIKSRKK